MTEDELNRKFEFIANVLADLSARQQQEAEQAAERARLDDERARLADKRMTRSEERMDRLERVLLLAIRAGQRERREWRTQHAALAETVRQLAAAQAHTDRRLDALIDIVREERNGRRGAGPKDE